MSTIIVPAIGAILIGFFLFHRTRLFASLIWPVAALCHGIFVVLLGANGFQADQISKIAIGALVFAALISVWAIGVFIFAIKLRATRKNEASLLLVIAITSMVYMYLLAVTAIRVFQA